MALPNWCSPYKLPSNLTGTLHPLVCLIGLETEVNPVHRAISDVLNLKNINKEFQPSYNNVPLHYEFPTKKIKMENTEASIPSGILPKNWPTKHISNIPSVAFVFFDVNWSDLHWNDVKQNCARRVKELKAALTPHGTQVLVALIKAAVLTDDKDSLSNEKATAFCGSAEIVPKALFVLQNTTTDRLQMFASRLETGMREWSKLYYSYRIKKVKSWMDKTPPTPRLVRYHFKTAFFQEIRRDYLAALSHYQSAMDAVLSIKVSDANILELRTVGSIINYRMCRMYLLKSEIKESKTHFDNYIRNFSKVEGNQELAFERFGWMENQYHHYGDLLRQYHRKGTTNMADPVTYFMTAATYAQKRRDYANQHFSQEISLPPEFEDYRNDVDLKYFGQRPWREASFGLETAYLVESPNVILALKYMESICLHSKLIIGYFGNASEFCKETQRSRTRCQLMDLMGEEFYKSKEYSKCIMLMTHVLRELGQEKWTKIIFNAAEIGLKASCWEGDVPAYINFLITLLKLDLSELLTKERRHHLWSKFKAVLEGRVPLPENDCEINLEAWEKAANPSCTSFVGVHQNPIVDAQIYFLQPVIRVATEASIRFLLRNQNDHPVEVRKYGVRSSMAEYNCESDILSVCLQPGEIKSLELKIKPAPRDLSKHIQLQVGYIDIGTEKASVILHYSLVLPSNTYMWDTWASDKYRYLSAKVEPTKPMLQVEITRNDPVLVNEWHKVSFRWTNQDSLGCHRIVFTYILGASNSAGATLTENPAGEVNYGRLSCTAELATLAAGESFKTELYVKTSDVEENEFKVLARARYIDGNHQLLNVDRLELMTIAPPFFINQSFTNRNGKEIDKIPSNGDFFLQLGIENVSSCPLRLNRCQLQLDLGVSQVNSNQELQIEETVLQPKELATLKAALFTHVDTISSLGHLKLNWLRAEDASGHMTCTEFPLSWVGCGATTLALEVEFSNDGQGKLKQPMKAIYTISNYTKYAYDLVMSMDSNDSFMTSGCRKMNIKLKGLDSCKFNYVIFPLAAGSVPAPRLCIDLAPNFERTNGIPPLNITRAIPETILVTR